VSSALEIMGKEDIVLYFEAITGHIFRGLRTTAKIICQKRLLTEPCLDLSPSKMHAGSISQTV
jgi:hypothetical protein